MLFATRTLANLHDFSKPLAVHKNSLLGFLAFRGRESVITRRHNALGLLLTIKTVPSRNLQYINLLFRLGLHTLNLNLNERVLLLAVTAGIGARVLFGDVRK